jgi:hypothetical protein
MPDIPSVRPTCGAKWKKPEKWMQKQLDARKLKRD